LTLNQQVTGSIPVRLTLGGKKICKNSAGILQKLITLKIRVEVKETLVL